MSFKNPGQRKAFFANLKKKKPNQVENKPLMDSSLGKLDMPREPAQEIIDPFKTPKLGKFKKIKQLMKVPKV